MRNYHVMAAVIQTNFINITFSVFFTYLWFNTCVMNVQLSCYGCNYTSLKYFKTQTFWPDNSPPSVWLCLLFSRPPLPPNSNNKRHFLTHMLTNVPISTFPFSNLSMLTEEDGTINNEDRREFWLQFSLRLESERSK